MASIYFNAPKQLWIAQGKINGKRKAFTGKTEEEATNKLNAAVHQAQSLEDWLASEPSENTSPPPAQTPSDTLTFAELFSQFVAAKKTSKWGINSQRTTHYLAEKHILPALGHLQLRNIAPFNIQAFYTGLSRLAQNSQRRITQLVTGALDHAANLEIIQHSPARKIERPAKRKNKVVPLTLDQQHALIAACQPERHKPIILTALHTGMRKGEIFALHWPDINWQDGTIAISKNLARDRGHKPLVKGPKTEAGNRVIVITNDLLDILADHRLAMEAEGRDTDNGIVFPSDLGTYLDPSAFARQCWNRVTVQVGIKTKFHALRHTHASHLLNSGWPMHDVQHRLGHGDVIITMQTYGHMIPKSIADDRTRLAAALPSFQTATQLQPDCNHAATA